METIGGDPLILQLIPLLPNRLTLQVYQEIRV